MPLTALLPHLRRFLLRRASDPTGVSGAGVIALGVQFPDGRCVLQWAPPAQSLVIHAGAAEIEGIHGHGGQTVLEWIDEAPNA
jgi:hypothetical protein